MVILCFAACASVIWFFVGFALLFQPGKVCAIPLGDLDGDQAASVRDLARLVAHLNGTDPLPDTQIPIADMDQDGAIGQGDADLLISEILGTRNPAELPLSTIRHTAPGDGDSDIAITRESIITFTIPLALGTSIDTSRFSARFGSRQILSRVELAGDRLKATLFYLEPLPSNARIDVHFDGDGLNDILGRPFDGDGDGVGGGDSDFTFETLSITPISGTAIRGRVFASEPGAGQSGAPIDVPLRGVTITVDGAEETMRAETDANGDFVLDPCPAGPFFVHIDGRTSPLSDYPSGNYYPSVGKSWFALAGRTDNLATDTGDLYLPLVCQGTLKTVSSTGRTDITFPQDVLTEYPELQGAVISVPPNSLFADDGTRGGKVGIAPVAPQRLPSPLPPGLDLPLVITIQTDGGANFDQPVPICLPNLPDPVTGETLAPGSISALWSFNHDSGEWDVVGSMTVSADGNFVKTDPGVGVKQPGWHGSRPGSQCEGEGPVCPVEEDDDSDDPEDDEEIDCPNGFNSWTAAQTLYSVVKEVGECAIKVTKIKTLARCLHTMVKFTVDIASSASDFQNQMNEGFMRLETAKSFLAHIKKLKAALTGNEGCITDITPSNQAKQVFDCFGNAINIGESLCDIIDPQGAPPPPGCEAGYITKNLCYGVRGTKRLHREVASIVNLIKKYESQLALGATCFVIDQVEFAVTDMIAARTNGAPKTIRFPFDDPDVLTAQEVALLRARTTNVVHESGLFVQAGSEYPELANHLDESHRLISDMLQDASREITRVGQRARGVTYWAIDVDVITLRGKVQPGGRINVLLPPDEGYTVKVFNPTMGLYDEAPGFSAPNGRASRLSATILDPSSLPLPDADGDGVPDPAEHVLGTSTNAWDTDLDGISDLAEAQQGSDPAGGLLVNAGVIASVPSSGTAEDVCAGNDLALTANGTAGVSVYNVFSGLNPTRIAEFDTPGSALAVVCFGARVAVADYNAGLAIVDISDPSNVRFVRQVSLPDPAVAVTANGPTAYAGTVGGSVYAVDMFTGSILDQVFVGAGQVQDLTVLGDTLYVLRSGTVSSVPLNAGALVVSNHVAAPGGLGAGRRRLRIFGGDGTLYTTWRQGYNVFDLRADPLLPGHVQQVSTGQQGWKQMVRNGSGLGIAAVSPNSTSDGPHHIDLYNVGSDGRSSSFLVTLPTPGLAAAVSVYNGLAYVADSRAGLTVVNYRAFDAGGVPPSIVLTGGVAFVNGQAEEGQLFRVSAEVGDDVQVRQVQFYLDGALVWTDGNFPFEYRFITPPLSNVSFRVQARAEDTGGNTNWSLAHDIILVPDAVAPLVEAFGPGDGSLVLEQQEVWVLFNELMNESSLSSALSLYWSGTNGVFGDGDDQFVTNGTLRFREESLTAFLSFVDPLPAGGYVVEVGTSASDLAGNMLVNSSSNSFRIVSNVDTDGDGLPDDWELLLGLDPGQRDSNTNSVEDGDEDYDGDGVANALELRLRLDPRTGDSDGDGINDGAEDFDGDGLSNAQESALGTDPELIDSDGDGLDDFTENATGSDPKDAASGTSTMLESLAMSYIQTQNDVKPLLLFGGAVGSEAASYINPWTDPKPALATIHAWSESASYFNVTGDPKPASLQATTAAKVITYKNEN